MPVGRSWPVRRKSYPDAVATDHGQSSNLGTGCVVVRSFDRFERLKEQRHQEGESKTGEIGGRHRRRRKR